jgi:hypothetical protein
MGNKYSGPSKIKRENYQEEMSNNFSIEFIRKRRIIKVRIENIKKIKTLDNFYYYFGI